MSQPAHTREAGLAALLAALFAIYAPALVHLEQGTLGAFKFFAADTFYYLAIAERSGAVPGFSFDGLHPTNGFHPLWGWIWAGVFDLLQPGRSTQVELVFFASIALTAAAAALLAASVARATGHVGLALLTAVPGLYYLLLPAFNPHYSPLWSFANGMESPLVLLLFALMLQVLVRRAGDLERLHRRISVGLLAAALTLARLDDGVFVVSIAAAIAIAAPTWRSGFARAAHFAIAPALCIGAMLLYNLHYAGVALPISGTAKAQGLFGLVRNGYGAMTTLLPPVDPLGRGAIFWGDQAYRIAQMLVPAAAAAVWLLRERSDTQRGAGDEALRTATSIVAGGILLKAGYNFAFVGLWHQGHWYYPASIVGFGWIVALWIHEWRTRRAPTTNALALGPLRIPGRAVSTSLCALVALLSANAYAYTKTSSDLHLLYHRVWERRDAIEQALDSVCAQCGVLEFDDGILAYSLARPVMSGSGLALDVEGDRARRRGELLALAHERGFRLIASLYYALDDAAYATPETLKAHLARTSFLRDQEIDGWRFEVAHVDEPTGVVFIRFEPARPDEHAPRTEPAP